MSLLSFGKWDRDRCHSGEEVRREDSESTAFWKFIIILSYIFFSSSDQLGVNVL